MQPDGPRWLDQARKYIGLSEIPGKRHNSKIVEWWNGLFRDDETPWCGAFVGGVLRECGMPVVKSFAGARNWLNYNVTLDRPAYGAIVVFWRGKRSGWSGHVGFVVGKDRNGNLMVLGGNQGNAVNIKPFLPDTHPDTRVLGYRWPGFAPYKERYELPLLDSDGRASTNEA